MLGDCFDQGNAVDWAERLMDWCCEEYLEDVDDAFIDILAVRRPM